MLKDHNIIYFAPERWDGLWRNRQQLMSVFSRYNRVLYVEGRLHLKGLRRQLLSGELSMAELQRPRLRQALDNLFVFNYPAWAPITGRLTGITESLRRLALQNTMRQLNMSNPIVWLSRPMMTDLFAQVPFAPSLYIYHVVDEYTTYTNQTDRRRTQLANAEKRMMAQADMLVVVSKQLYEAKSPFNPHTHLIANGVNYQAYTAALADETLPPNLCDIPQPRLGYIGLIGDKLNLKMLRDIAVAHPEWSLVLLGEARVTEQADVWQAMQALPNVHHLAAVGADQVPHYVKGFQIGLMPYKQDRHADNISPLKLYDYLAAGIPIASLDIPASRKFSQVVHLAATPDGFAGAIETALADDTPERMAIRRDVAAQNTWEARVEQLSDLITERLAQKQAN